MLAPAPRGIPRGIPAGEASISPNRHPEITDAASLLEMIARVRAITGKPVGFKAVFGGYGWFEDFLELISLKGSEYAPDFITVDSGDGGTGAAPQALMDNVGLPIRESLPVVVDLLRQYNLKLPDSPFPFVHRLADTLHPPCQ